jgi:hypothetical protein
MGYTKGKWQAGESLNCGIHCVDALLDDGALTEICEVWGTAVNTNENDESKANLKLIIAAPVIFDSLKKLYNAIDSCIDITPSLLEEVRDAIGLVEN